jgi:hypothetical protein
MKQTAVLDRIQAEMRPGAISREGFLGADERKLADILAQDEAIVNRLGLTHAQVAAAMKRFRDAGRAGLGMEMTVGPHFEVRVDSVRGKMPCPFLHQGIYQKNNTTVRNLLTGQEVTYTDLNIHMIEEHGFYEGRDALFRLDPERLAAVLEIA